MQEDHVEQAKEAEVVISSRIRLARNVDQTPFPSRMREEQGNQVVEAVKNAVIFGNREMQNNFSYLNIPTMSTADRQVLVEKHLISPLIATKNNACGVIVSKDERISILINEEDHLRIQCLFPGMQLHQAWKLCDQVDTLLEEKIDFAYDHQYGYLTCCPTNVGTGMRASVMLHLPALMMTGYINNILEACGKIGVAVRGIYGENSQAAGNMFQISNQVTLGQTEEKIIAGIRNITYQIIDQEKSLRQGLLNQNRYQLEDRIFRSYGIFKNARILSSEESLKLLSDVRLGVDMGMIKDVDVQILNELMVQMQSANLQKSYGVHFNPEERDIKRAELVRNRFINVQ